MKLVGTVSECRNDKGLYILTIRGLPILPCWPPAASPILSAK